MSCDISLQLVARQAERDLKESKKEAAMLRQKLVYFCSSAGVHLASLHIVVLSAF